MDGRYKTWESKTLCRTGKYKKRVTENRNYKIFGGEIMSTRGRIAIKENGKYTYIYNHCDSYIDGLGIILYKFYKDVNKVKGLISLGNTANVGPTVEEGGSKTYREHMSKPLEQRGTVAAF